MQQFYCRGLKPLLDDKAVNALIVYGFSVGYKMFYELRMLPMVVAASFWAEVVTWA